MPHRAAKAKVLRLVEMNKQKEASVAEEMIEETALIDRHPDPVLTKPPLDTTPEQVEACIVE